MFSSINLKDELIKEKNTQCPSISFIDDIKQMIQNEIEEEKSIENTINNSKSGCQLLDLDLLDNNNIFDVTEIKKLAIKYRLRFLPTKYFKREIPKEAIFKIKGLNKSNSKKIQHFKILAPSKAFDLEDENADPLLFIPLTRTKYYLVHQWGNELKWHKKIFAFPLRSLDSIIIFIGTLAAITALITPTWLILNSAEIDMGYWGYHRMAWFFFSYILFTSLTTFICFSQAIYPSEYNWNKKTYN